MQMIVKAAAMGLSAALLSILPEASAQTYPSKELRIVISYPAGGSTDFLARTVAQTLAANTGQTVLIENRPGGNFVIAADAVAKASADGYTVLMASDSTFTLNPLRRTPAPYDADRDFAPVSLVALQPQFVVASGKAPAKTLKDMLAYAKTNPGKLTFASSALVSQLMGEQVKLATKTDIVHVPFKGSPQILQALLSGEVDFAIVGFTPYANYTKDGRLTGLAVTGTRRAMLVPETPTLAELGLGEAGTSIWYGAFVPARTPRAIQERLHREFVKALLDPATRQRLVEADLEPATSTPEELREKVRADRQRWRSVLESARIVLD
jgi:tripartite-type tricarboxylate transporter receptor subunit TctC